MAMICRGRPALGEQTQGPARFITVERAGFEPRQHRPDGTVCVAHGPVAVAESVKVTTSFPRWRRQSATALVTTRLESTTTIFTLRAPICYLRRSHRAFRHP